MIIRRDHAIQGIGLFCSLLGIVLNAQKDITCWPVWIASDVFWLWHFIPKKDWDSVVLWVVFALFNVYGWMQWGGL